jgi:hypothetical protein
MLCTTRAVRELVLSQQRIVAGCTVACIALLSQSVESNHLKLGTTAFILRIHVHNAASQ